MALYHLPTSDFVQKTLNADLLSGVTAAATLNNVTAIQNNPGVMIIDRINTNNVETPNKVEVISFAATSGSTVTTLVRGLAGTTEQDHAVGAIVEFGPDIIWAQGVIDALLNLVDQTGAVDLTKVVTPSGTQTLFNKMASGPSLSGAQLKDPFISIPTLTLGSDAAGDLFYRGAGGTLIRLPIGSDTQILTANASLPFWSNGTFASGASGSVFTSTGNGSNPVFAPLPSSTVTYVGARAKRTTNQSISQATVTKVQLNAEDFDTAGAFDSSTNFRYTVPTGGGGKYLLQGEISWDSGINSGKRATVQIQVGGTAVASTQIIPGAANFITINCSTVYLLAQTNIVELYAYQDGTGAVNLTAAHLTVSFLGA